MPGITGTRLQNDLTQHRMNQTRASLGKQEAAMMTGVKTQNYAEMSTDVSRASTYQNMADKLESYAKNGEIISKKLFYQEKNLDTILKNLISFKGTLVSSNAPEMAKEGQLKEVAIRLKEALAESLSASTGGNYVFGGLMQDEVPIDLSNPQDLKDGTYYRGSDENMNMHFHQMKEETEIGINANHSGFQKAFDVIQKIIDSPLSQTVIGAVQIPLDDAIKELSDALGLLGMQQAKINDDVEMNKEVIQMMDDFLVDTVKTDPAEASLMISLLKQRLDASMHLLVNKESMINFIRGR